MEEILGVEMRPPISLREFLKDWKSTLKSTIIPRSTMDIQNAMNLSEHHTRFMDVSQKCALDLLSSENDVKTIKFEPGITHPSRYASIVNDSVLKTYNELSREKSQMQNQKNPFKRTRETYPMIPTPDENGDVDTTLNFYEDLMVKVRIYRPARAVHSGQSLEKPVFAEEFECLGSNYLSELRDKIACVCKNKRFFDISDNPTAELPEKTTDPAYFFINNMFYNDHRLPENPDYSAVIREWAKKAVGLIDLNFEVDKMETTRFIDLTVSIGFPQLYQHHGNCEHVFTISQVEVLVPGIAHRKRDQYPRLTSYGHFNKSVCNMCGTRSYTFVVTKSDRQLQDPAYICSKCFFDYHYIDGKKIGSFQAYRLNEYNEDLTSFNKRTRTEIEYSLDDNEEAGTMGRSRTDDEEDNIVG